MAKELGRHIIADLKGCDPSRLTDVELIERMLIEAARLSNATVVTSSFHRFGDLGVSGCVIVAESHICVHTWPEYKAATVDVYTCGEHTDPMKGIFYIIEQLKAYDWELQSIRRGDYLFLEIPDSDSPRYGEDKDTQYFGAVPFNDKDLANVE